MLVFAVMWNSLFYPCSTLYCVSAFSTPRAVCCGLVCSCRAYNLAFSLRVLWRCQAGCCNEGRAESHIDTKSNVNCCLDVAAESQTERVDWEWVGL